MLPGASPTGGSQGAGIRAALAGLRPGAHPVVGRSLLAVLGPALLALGLTACGARVHEWSLEEQSRLRALWIESLPPLPPDPSNAVADDPAAAALGHALFFEPRLSRDGRVSCASCHQPARHFTDGKPRGEGLGTARRHTPSIVGASYSPWQFWDGRRDSQWAQAIVPLEDPAEHGGDRSAYARLIAERYREPYEAIFGPLPPLEDRRRFPQHAGPVADSGAATAWRAMAAADRRAVTQVFVNIGKSLAAYERRIQPGAGRFDTYVAAVLAGDRQTARRTFDADEAAGLRLFIGPARCTDCHAGPRLTNDSFHNIGLPLRESGWDAAGKPRPLSIEELFDPGREAGVIEAIEDASICLGPWSDAPPEACAELRFARVDGDPLVGAFKVPSLRNVAETAPYMHDGRFASLAELLQHYNTAPLAIAGHSDLTPLGLRDHELSQIEAFLRTIDGAVSADRSWLAPPAQR